MQHNQVPTVAKIKYLEGALKALNECRRAPRADPEIVREWEYQIEVVEAILDDYKQKAKTDDAPR